jgi:hypothetical protein
MKSLLFLFLLFCLASLYAQTEPAFIPATYNPSSTSLAMGDVTGVANVWSGDPLNVWSNPALVAFHEGVRVGYTHYKWMQGLNWGDLTEYNSSSYASYAKNGWGFSMPMLNYDQRWGTTFDYGLFRYGSHVPANHSYDTSSEVTGAYNPFVRMKYENDNLFMQSIDASFGLSLNFLSSRWEQYNLLEEDPDSVFLQKIDADTTPLNGGVAVKFDWSKCFKIKNLELQSSVGWSMKNIIDTQVKYENSEIIYHLPQDNTIAGGFFIGLPIAISGITNPFFKEYCAHLVTIQLMSGILSSKYGNNASGQGYEISMLDIFYMRFGDHYVDHVYNTETTKGWGVKLHYDKWAAQYNSAIYYQGSLEQKTWDVSVAYLF